VPVCPTSLAGGESIYAIDQTIWPRCDAECRPERAGVLHPPATPRAGRSWPRLPPLLTDDPDHVQIELTFLCGSLVNSFGER
jgi:hypothetical protein